MDVAAFLHLSDGDSRSLEDWATPQASRALAPGAHTKNFILLFKVSPKTVLDKSFPIQTTVRVQMAQASFQPRAIIRKHLAYVFNQYIES